MAKKLTQEDIIRMNKAAARREDIQSGANLVSFRRVHKNKKAYDRKSIKKVAF